MEQFWKDTAVSDDVLAHSIAEVRRALGDSSRDPQYLKTVPKRGYLFVGDVQEVATEAVIATEQITTIQVREEYSDEPLPRRYPKWALAVALLVLAVGSAAALVIRDSWPASLPNDVQPGIRTVILQFENRSGRADLEWLRVGLADMLATTLSASPRIALITSAQLQRELGQSSVAPIRPEAVLGAARRAGARAVIAGAFASIGETIRLDAQIYDVSTGRLAGGETVTVDKPAFLLSQLDPLAARLATRLGAPLAAPSRLAEAMTNNVEAYRLYSLGLARTREFRLKEAIEFYQKALELDPEFAMAYARIGYTYSSTWGRTVEGKPYLEKAYRLSNRLTTRDRLFIRGWYAMACRDYESAEGAYREILAAYPTEIEAYDALGTLVAGDRRYDEARQILERGLAIKPDMPQLYNRLSGAYFELGQNIQGLESAKRYLALSGEANAYDSMGMAFQRTGRFDEARTSYLEAIRRKPDFEIAIVHLGNLYFQLGRYRDALSQYEEYVRLAPSDADRARGHGSRAWVYWRKGDFANADRELAEAGRVYGSPVRERLLVASSRGELALTGEMRRDILAGTNLASRGTRENQRFAHFVLGYVAFRDHQIGEAIEQFRAVLREPSAYWNIDPFETCLGDALLELGRLDEAVAEYNRVLSANPNYPMARYRLGVALERNGMQREARAELERFLTIWKDADRDVPELVDARQRFGRAGSAF